VNRPESGGRITDLHSHLVPGVDDGAPTLDDAMEGVGRMVERGVGHIVTTPHLLGSLARDPRALHKRLDELDEGFRLLSREVSRVHPQVVLERGCEVMLDRPDTDLSDERLRLGSGNYVLVEWPGLRVPPETPSVVRSIREQGVNVLIAHPERYAGYDAGLNPIRPWREEGAFLQVNHGSLVGRYGSEVQARAFRLLAEGWVDCMASDFHGRPALRLFIEGARRVFQDMDALDTWQQLTEVNPDRIARGLDPLPVAPVSGSQGRFRRLLARFRS